MGKKSREKRAKQQERDRKKLSEEGGASTSSPGASTSRVAEPDHHDTPAAAAMPSTDDTHDDDEPASIAVSASDSTAAVAEKLLAFCQSCMERLGSDIQTWVNGEFSGNIDAVKAAAERGDAKAQYAIGFMMSSGNDWGTLLGKALNQGYPDATLATGLVGVKCTLQGSYPQGQGVLTHAIAKRYLTESAVDHNSADAQYIRGMLDCWQHENARSKPDMLETARWFRMAARQGLAEAQWELGEWFRRGVFCDVHMGFARKYIRRASKQGHAAALGRMAELLLCCIAPRAALLGSASCASRRGTATPYARRSTGARAAASSAVTVCRTRQLALARTLTTAPAATRATTTASER
jgi:hypothetical protein